MQIARRGGGNRQSGGGEGATVKWGNTANENTTNIARSNSKAEDNNGAAIKINANITGKLKGKAESKL